MIKSQANLVARFSFSLEEAEQQKEECYVFELAKVCDQFIERCQSNLNRAYLEVTRLVSLADDKEKQSQAFRLMELALEEQLRLSRSQQLLGEIESCSQDVEGQCFFSKCSRIYGFELRKLRSQNE